MYITVTLKMQAESQEELTNVFGSHVKACRAHFDELKANGIFGPADKVDLRYLIIGGSWREEPDVPVIAETVEAVDTENVEPPEAPTLG